MREQPTGESLLDTAREVLKTSILPLLEGDAKRDLLMAMNAIGIAQRELQLDSHAEMNELQSVEDLLGRKFANLQVANRQLALHIRQGLADPLQDNRPAVLAHLRQVAKGRLQVSNPKVLKP